MASTINLASAQVLSRPAAVPRGGCARPQVAAPQRTRQHEAFAGRPAPRGAALLWDARRARAAAVGEAASSEEGDGVFAMAEAAYDDGDEMSAADLKAALLDSLFGTDRGLSARSEVRAEINELITQLEAKNPTPSPTEIPTSLNGDWRLVYTSNSELLGILALGKLPFVTIGDITQRVDAATSTVENKVEISVPLSSTAVSTTASFEVRSPKRLAIRFERGAISTPRLLSDLTLPDTVTLLGQTVDLAPLRGALQPVESGLSSLLSSVGGLLSRQPDLSFPLPGAAGGRSETWLLTTYLDDDTRITRGDGGSVFILVKEVVVATPSEIIEPPSSSAAAVPAGPPAATPVGYI